MNRNMITRTIPTNTLDLILAVNNIEPKLVKRGCFFGNQNKIDLTLSDHEPILVCLDTPPDTVKDYSIMTTHYPDDPKQMLTELKTVFGSIRKTMAHDILMARIMVSTTTSN